MSRGRNGHKDTLDFADFERRIVKRISTEPLSNSALLLKACAGDRAERDRLMKRDKHPSGAELLRRARGGR